MSEHSDNIRQSSYHARKCRYCEEKLLAAADYVDELEQQRDLLSAAVQRALDDVALDPGNRWLQHGTVSQLTAAVRACEK